MLENLSKKDSKNEIRKIKVGQGAYGTAYRADNSGIVFCIKEQELSGEDQYNAIQELKILKKLNHPSIVKY
jgi:serine/threonine protein kinase